jgi:predicted RNase H-like nuclease (RuvC/YqgF family)
LPETTIVGVDGYPHYTLGGSKSRRYAVTILEDGLVTARHKKISRTRLLHLIHLRKPTYVAVDNVHEFATHVSGLRHFFSQLPADTQVIQVTGFPEDAGSLQHKASAQGLARPAATSPLDESEACARLTEKGVGATVHVLEDETKILVCRTVSLGSGGSSQTRYRRRIHASILNLKKRVANALQQLGMDYDLFTADSDFGLDRASFHVYASRASLRGVIKPYRGKYVALKISPVYRNHIDFTPLTPLGDSTLPPKGASKQLILGIDPGTTCGVAILTLDASLLYLKSRKGLTRGEITRQVMEYGRPLLVAADVTPAPAFVKKLAHMLNAVLFVPDAILGAAEKREITRLYAEKHAIPLRNAHARDALAAAIKAFQRYKNKFEQIEVEAQRVVAHGSLDEVKALVVRGQPIQRALDAAVPTEPRDATEKPVGPLETPPEVMDAEPTIQGLHDRMAFYREQVRQLKASNERLLHEARRRDERIQSLAQALDAARRAEAREIKQSRMYQQLTRQLNMLRRELAKERQAAQRLENRLETLRHYRGLASKGDVVFLKPIEAFTKDGLEQAYRLYDITRGDTILFLDASGGGASTAEELVKRGVRAVVSRTPMAHQAAAVFATLGVAIVPYPELNVEWVEGYPYVKAEELDAVLKKRLVEKRTELNAKLLGIVDDYKRERQQAGKRTPVH